jgi:hypothetical protein
VSRPHLIQYLCGPRRHILFVIAYNPDELPPAAALAIADHEAHAGAPVTVCPVCRSPRSEWFSEEIILDQCATLEDAQIHVERMHAAALTAQAHWQSRN